MFRRILAGFAAAALPLAVASPAGAVLVIDDFVTQQVLSLDVGGADSAASSVAATEAIGGERDALLDRIQGDNPADLLVNGSGTDELLSCSSSSNTISLWAIVWDGPDGASTLDPDGLGGIDLTEGGANEGFRLGVLSDLPVTLTFEVTGSSGGEATAELVLPGGDTALTRRFLPFSAFDVPALLADAGSVSLAIEGGAGLDPQIDGITVPEPSGAAIAATCALLALATRRRSA